MTETNQEDGASAERREEESRTDEIKPPPLRWTPIEEGPENGPVSLEDIRMVTRDIGDEARSLSESLRGGMIKIYSLTSSASKIIGDELRRVLSNHSAITSKDLEPSKNLFQIEGRPDPDIVAETRGGEFDISDPDDLKRYIESFDFVDSEMAAARLELILSKNNLVPNLAEEILEYEEESDRFSINIPSEDENMIKIREYFFSNIENNNSEIDPEQVKRLLEDILPQLEIVRRCLRKKWVQRNPEATSFELVDLVEGNENIFKFIDTQLQSLSDSENQLREITKRLITVFQQMEYSFRQIYDLDNGLEKMSDVLDSFSEEDRM